MKKYAFFFCFCVYICINYTKKLLFFLGQSKSRLIFKGQLREAHYTPLLSLQAFCLELFSSIIIKSIDFSLFFHFDWTGQREMYARLDLDSRNTNLTFSSHIFLEESRTES